MYVSSITSSASDIAEYYYQMIAPWIEFVWNGFSSGRATELASVRSCQKFPLYLTESMPAGSKTDPLLAKAKPFSDGDSASGIFKKGEKTWVTAFADGERSENSAGTKVSDEGGGGGGPGARDSPAAHAEDHGEAGCSPAPHGGPQRSRYPPAAHGGPHTGAGRCLKEVVILWKAHAGAGSWHDLWPCGEREADAGAGLLAGLVTPWGTHAGAVCS